MSTCKLNVVSVRDKNSFTKRVMNILNVLPGGPTVVTSRTDRMILASEETSQYILFFYLLLY